MNYDEKIALLKSLPLLKRMPERQLTSLAEFLKPRALAAGERLFEEGATGMSLYFVGSGRIVLSQRMHGGGSRDLAYLGPGQFFGEMGLIAEVPRTATATAAAPTTLFELFRGDLSRWTSSNAQQAVQFFAELLAVQSRRLRRASWDLTLHLELARRPAGGPTADAVLGGLLDGVVAHFNGTWSVGAYLGPDDGLTLAVSRGPHEFPAQAAAAPGAPHAAWLDDSTLRVALRGSLPLGHLVFRAKSPAPKDEQDEVEQTFSTVADSIAHALQRSSAAA